jgi:hypothetical protein
VKTRIRIHVWGLGYSRVEIEDLSFGADLRLLVLPVPTESPYIDLRVGVSVFEPRRSQRMNALLRAMPAAIVQRLLRRIVLRIVRSEVAQDSAISAHKRHVSLPPLARGDGPVHLYRRWASQFYDASV